MTVFSCLLCIEIERHISLITIALSLILNCVVTDFNVKKLRALLMATFIYV